MAYRVNVKRSAQKTIDRIPQKKARRRVEDRREALAEDPRPADSRQLQGELAVYRRVREGSYRIVYEVRDEELVVLVVAQRDDGLPALLRVRNLVVPVEAAERSEGERLLV